MINIKNENIKSMKNKILLIFIIGVLLNMSCKKDESHPPTSTSPPSEHHYNDGITDNGDGTSKVVLGGVSFNTDQRDFSGEPVVTDPKTVLASQLDEYSIAMNASGFGIENNYVISASGTTLSLYDMNSDSIVDSQTTSFDASGLSVNGCIVTTEGSEEVNFYNIKTDTIDKHFFRIPSVNGSKFLAVCYLDYNTVYVYDESAIISIPLDKTTITPKPKIMNVPSFANVNITSDKEYLYLALGNLSKEDPTDPNAPYINYSALRIYDKTMKKYTEFNSNDYINYTGITVDANYIYISIKDANIVKVINKHTKADAGTISVDTPTFLIKKDKNLFVYSADNQKLIKFDIVFN
jgi:hypothetical protein